MIESKDKIERKQAVTQSVVRLKPSVDMLGHPPFAVGLRYALSGPELDRDAK